MCATSTSLERAESALGWELRGALASGRTVRLVLSDACDGVYTNEEGVRVLEGRITRVAATNAYCVIQGRHVPLAAISSVLKPHWQHSLASDPSDPLDRPGDYTDWELEG